MRNIKHHAAYGMTREIAWAAIRDWVEDVYYWKCQDVLDDGENLSQKDQRFVRLHESARPPVNSSPRAECAQSALWAGAGRYTLLAKLRLGCLQRVRGGGEGMQCRISLGCRPVAEAQ